MAGDQYPKPKNEEHTMPKYYEVTGLIDGNAEVLFGSFDREDCEYELEAERDSLKDDGYRRLKITARHTDDEPAAEVYGDDFVADA